MLKITAKVLVISLILAALITVFSCSKEKPFPLPSFVNELQSIYPPAQAINKFPQDESTDIYRIITFSWQGALMYGDSLIPGDSLLYDFYFNVDSVFNFNNLISEQQPDTFFALTDSLLKNKKYYWKVDVRDQHDNWALGKTWSFTTGTLIDTPPVASILSPSDLSEFVIHEEVTFRGTAVDEEDGILSGSSVSWSSSIDGSIGTDTLFATTGLSGGDHTITFRAADSKGGTSSNVIQITVIDTTSYVNTPPEVHITNPVNNKAFVENSTVVFSGTAVDIEDGVMSGGSVTWTSDVAGLLGTGTEISVESLSLGQHIITMRAVDSESAESTDVIRIVITPSGAANTLPSALISLPMDGSVFTVGTGITLQGAGDDEHDGSMFGDALTWLSDIDGILGIGNTLAISTLSIGRHVVSLVALDSGGLADTAYVHINIQPQNNTAPVARFNVFQNLPVSNSGTVDVTLDASIIYDREDPVEFIEVRWDLDNDGVWDTEYTTEKPRIFQYTRDIYPRYVSLQTRDISGMTDDITLIVPEVVHVPSGSFNMGSSSGSPDEQPQHTVTLNEYYIDRYEIMNWQYAAFLSDNGNPVYYSSNMSIRQLEDGSFIAENGRENFPVTFVDWTSANAYAEWYEANLPTEAQWEKAARGGLTNNPFPNRDYPWGSGLSPAFANYLITGRPYNGLGPVAVYTGLIVNEVQTMNNASIFGAYDLIGNAAEWVSDYYQQDYYSISPENNPTGPVAGQLRVYRGGSFDTPDTDIRITKRFSALPTARPYHVGFRCVINP